MRWLAAFMIILGFAACTTEPEQHFDAARLAALAKARTELAAAYYQRGQYGIALEELAKAVRADSGYAPAYNMRGLVHMALGEDADAESDFRRSLNIDSGNSNAHNNFGWFLCQRGHEREAVKHFLIAASDPLYTTPGKAYLNAGICSKKAGDMGDATIYLQRALNLQPDSPEALIGLAEVSFIGGDFASAISYFKRYEKASTEQLSAENIFLAIRIARGAGDRRAESAYTAQLRNKFPNSREARSLGQIR